MTDKTRLIVLIISTLLIIVADICISITLEKTLPAVLTMILTIPMICVNIYTIAKLTKN